MTLALAPNSQQDRSHEPPQNQARRRGARAERPQGDSGWVDEVPGPGPFDPERVLDAGLRLHHLANTAYPIAHRKTIWHHRQPSARHRTLLSAAWRRPGPMSLYAHIPFCERRCAFCEYAVLPAHTEELEAVYHRALLRELELQLALIGRGRKTLVGFDIGGGTPSLIDPARIGELVERVLGSFQLAPHFGMSIETTPRIAAASLERLQAYRRLGIDRISMGLQMVNPRLLREYGRDLNRVGDNRRAVDSVRRAGYRCLNIDLMYGFARQSVEEFRRSLEYTIGLGPEVITLYRMRYKGTSVEGEAPEIALQRVVDMYQCAREVLASGGYLATPGKNAFCRVPGDPGTSAYLTSRVVWGTPYLGLGLGAQTFTGNLLGYNHGAASKRLEAYLAATSAGELPLQDLYHLPRSEGMAKMISVSFYFGQIHRVAFRRCFGVSLEERFPAEVELLLRRGLMEPLDDCLRLTDEGARLFNGVVALFYSDRVKAHLLDLEKSDGTV